MEKNVIPEVVCPFANVPQQRVVDIPTSAAEKSDNIRCSVVPHMRDSPTQV